MKSAILVVFVSVAVVFSSFASSAAPGEDVSARGVPAHLNVQILNLLRQQQAQLRQQQAQLNRIERCACHVPPKVYKDCADLYRAGKRRSGVYTINPGKGGAFRVYCDQTTAGGGWTVFQRRFDGAVNFFRGWHDYKIGFGKPTGEYWLGLDKINRLSHSGRYRLRVDLQDTKGNKRYAEYNYFAVASENAKYKLSIGTYTGNAGDSLTHHAGAPFSTKDRDNDSWGKNCATSYHGAWWYKACHFSNLNGKYLLGHHKSYANGVTWYHWKGYHYSLKKTQMALRPVKL